MEGRQSTTSGHCLSLAFLDQTSEQLDLDRGFFFLQILLSGCLLALIAQKEIIGLEALLNFGGYLFDV